MIDTAIAYLRAGLCPLPAILAEKRPDLSGWKQYQKRLPTEHQVQHWFTDSQPICLLTGAVSGNLELIDFDFEGELFNPWAELVEAEAPGPAGAAGHRTVAVRWAPRRLPLRGSDPWQSEAGTADHPGAERPGTRDLRQAVSPAPCRRPLRSHLHAHRNPWRRRAVPVLPDARLCAGAGQLPEPARR